MANMSTLEYIRSNNLNSKEILALLSMPAYDEDLAVTVKRNTITLQGTTFHCDIVFYADRYEIIRKYSDYTSYEYRDEFDEPLKKITEFYIGNERLSFAQAYTNDPVEMFRVLTLTDRKNNKVKYKRAFYTDDELNSSESYKAMKTEQGTRVHRVIRDDDNVILTSSYTFAEPVYSNPIVGQIASTVSILPPAIVQCFYKVTNPEQLERVSEYSNPVLLIDGTFTDLSTLNNHGDFEKRIGYRLLMNKTENDFQIKLDYSLDDPDKEWIISCPCKGDIITPDSIDRLISFLHKSEFLKEHSKDFPIEKRVITELINVKRDIIKNTSLQEYDFDFIECNINQPISYEELAFDIYEHLQKYYAIIVNDMAQTQNKAPSRR